MPVAEVMNDVIQNEYPRNKQATGNCDKRSRAGTTTQGTTQHQDSKQRSDKHETKDKALI